MVYCGKPSGGCSNCRERKVKCDQKEPECSQCEKRQQQCPGYRNIVDLMFRDESNHVIKKATTRPRARKRKHNKNGGSSPPLRPSAPDPGRVPCSSSTSSSTPDTASNPSPALPGLVIIPAATALGSGVLTSSSILAALPAEDRNGVENGEKGVQKETQRKASLAARRSRRNNGTRLIRDQRIPKNPSSSASYPLSSLISVPAAVIASTMSIPTSPLPQPICERGTAFFFARYVATDHGCYQNFDFIYEIWKPPFGDAAELDCVTASMTAVGLAGLSKVTRCPDTVTQAFQSYGTALHLANAALRDPREAVKDSTMLAVLILGTSGFYWGRRPQTVRAWQEHVNGAATLASMRGTAQFATRAGARMFLMLCHSVLISCIQSDLPMPREMVELRHELGRLRGGSTGPSWRVIETIYKALQVRHDIKTGVITDKEEIVDKLLEVEDEFAAVVAQLPKSWRYRRAQLSRPNPEVIGRLCHIYANFAQATTWNGMRTMRMLVQETIIEQLCSDVDTATDLSLRDQQRLAKAMGLLERLGEAVVAGVPQHFGIVSARDVLTDESGADFSMLAKKNSRRLLSIPSRTVPSPDQDGLSASSPTSPGPTLLDPTQSRTGPTWDAGRFMTLATASNTIIWPLYTLGMSASCSPEKMDYIIGRLEAVHNETGLEQARVVADMLRNKNHTLMWDRIPRSRLPQLQEGDLPCMV